jgi:2-iminobutanoate/2-iminopropanoate deaminase
MQKPLGPYTPVVRAGDWLIVSGQVGARDGVLADGVPAQTAQAIENLSAQLATMGATLADIKKTLCFLIDMDEFATFNEAYIAGFGDSRWARRWRSRPGPTSPSDGDEVDGAGRAGPVRVGGRPSAGHGVPRRRVGSAQA